MTYAACLTFVVFSYSFLAFVDASVKRSQNAAPQLPSSPDSTSKPHSPVIKGKSERNVTLTAKHFSREKSSDKGNVNAKRGFSERDSGPWSVKSDTSLPQPQQYDDMGGAVRNPLEDGTYLTPAKSTDKFEYFTEHYSPDPYVAAAQREEWMTVNTGNGVSPNPRLSRKSKRPKVKQNKDIIVLVKKAKIKHVRSVHNNAR